MSCGLDIMVCFVSPAILVHVLYKSKVTLLQHNSTFVTFTQVFVSAKYFLAHLGELCI